MILDRKKIMREIVTLEKLTSGFIEDARRPFKNLVSSTKGKPKKRNG